jgi:hypothetical protein
MSRLGVARVRQRTIPNASNLVCLNIKERAISQGLPRPAVDARQTNPVKPYKEPLARPALLAVVFLSGPS